MKAVPHSPPGVSRALPCRNGRARGGAPALLLLALGSLLLSGGVVLLADVVSATPPAEARQARALPWVPNAPLQRATGGAAPCVAPDEPSYGIVDPCPPVDWGQELEIRRAGGVRARPGGT